VIRGSKFRVREHDGVRLYPVSFYLDLDEAEWIASNIDQEPDIDVLPPDVAWLPATILVPLCEWVEDINRDRVPDDLAFRCGYDATRTVTVDPDPDSWEARWGSWSANYCAEHAESMESEVISEQHHRWEQWGA
jgi:hypothetical protein